MIELTKVKHLEQEEDIFPVLLTDETMEERKHKVLNRMEQEGFDSIIVWADMEHGSNFEYLCGFLPRFEEALLVLHKTGKAYMVLGNENLNKCTKARLKAKPIHMPYFSLPNQPMEPHKCISDILVQCELKNHSKIGIVGWKNFTSKVENNDDLFDLPVFVMDALRRNTPDSVFKNATYLFIGDNGVRTVNNANEFAHYEFGAALAGNCMLRALHEIKVGMSELELGHLLDAYGQPHSVVTIAAVGERFIKANMYPTLHKVELGEYISLTTGFKGGLQSHSGFAIENEAQLPKDQKEFITRSAKPYYKAICAWLENIHIGMTGNDLYEVINSILPKEIYGWTLNPGHLCADEEWVSSPIYEKSREVLKSGMLLQIDILPSVKGLKSINCECGILLADNQLRKDIQNQYPALWKRIIKRQNYIRNELGIQIREEILPTSVLTAYCAPFLLNKDFVFKKVS